jgi:hypothetical protein
MERRTGSRDNRLTVGTAALVYSRGNPGASGNVRYVVNVGLAEYDATLIGVHSTYTEKFLLLSVSAK